MNKKELRQQLGIILFSMGFVTLCMGVAIYFDLHYMIGVGFANIIGGILLFLKVDL